MSPIPDHGSASSIHQRANFPPGLEIKRCRLEEESPTAGNNLNQSSSERLNDDLCLKDVDLFGIAGKTWDASFPLLDFLVGRPVSSSSSDESKCEIKQPAPYRYPFQPVSPLLVPSHSSVTLRRTVILDLGSGTCHLPIGVARALSESKKYSNQRIDVIATDLEDVLPLLERNIAREKLAENVKVSARALTWGNPEELVGLINFLDLGTSHVEPTFEPETQFIITCSDLIFFRWLFGPLIRTLLLLTSPPACYPPTIQKVRPCRQAFPAATVFIGYKQRSEFLEFPFFSLLGRYFKLEPIISQSRPTLEPAELGNERSSQNSNYDEKEEEKMIHLLKVTRHPSTLDLDLSLVFDDEDPSSSNHSSLSKHGLAEGADQWELFMLSKLVF